MSKSLAIITYDIPHLKTVQVMQELLRHYPHQNIAVFGLPFRPFKPREVLFEHRPNQFQTLESGKIIAEKHGIPYTAVASDKDIPAGFDYYLITGAGILSAECVEGKKIINCHPGVIPAVRGLDSFKWSVLHQQPLGITLHYIDAEVDMGEIISIIKTPVKISDTIRTLADRHYDQEIYILAHFHDYITNPVNDFPDIQEKPSTMRMNRNDEQNMLDAAAKYIETFGE